MPTKFSIVFFLNLCFLQLGFAAPSKVDELLKESSQILPPNRISNESIFWQELRKKAGNPNQAYAVIEVEQLIRDLFESSKYIEERSEFFNCIQREGVYSLFLAGRLLVGISLSNSSNDTSKRQFEQSYRQYEKNCPDDVEKGKQFLDDVAVILGEFRNQRNLEIERKNTLEKQANDDRTRLQKQEAEARIDRIKALEKKSNDDLSRRKQEVETRNKEDERLRSERNALLKSGKVKPDSMEDVRLLTEAVNGVSVVHTPPFKPDMRVYWTWGHLVDWDGDRLLVKWGSNLYLVQTNKSTIFLGDTQRALGKNRPIQVVGTLTNIASTPAGKMSVFLASYISSP